MGHLSQRHLPINQRNIKTYVVVFHLWTGSVQEVILLQIQEQQWSNYTPKRHNNKSRLYGQYSRCWYENVLTKSFLKWQNATHSRKKINRRWLFAQPFPVVLGGHLLLFLHDLRPITCMYLFPRLTFPLVNSIVQSTEIQCCC